MLGQCVVREIGCKKIHWRNLVPKFEKMNNDIIKEQLSACGNCMKKCKSLRQCSSMPGFVRIFFGLLFRPNLQPLTGFH